MTINTEQMIQAACMFRDAADKMERTVGSLEFMLQKLTTLIDSGYGNNVEKLVQELEDLNNNKKML